MPRDIIPQDRGERRAWLLNLKDHIAEWAPVLGLSQEDVDDTVRYCTAQIALIDALPPAEAALRSARAAEKAGRTANETPLRKLIANWKTRRGYTGATGASLRLVSTGGASFNPLAYKCEFRVTLLGGKICIKWKKKGAFGVHIYARLAGETRWVQIDTDTSSPYIDVRPLAQPRVPDTREYMLRGIDIDDREIGVDSDIQSITWAGQ
jgi:hypothetical protein